MGIECGSGRSALGGATGGSAWADSDRFERRAAAGTGRFGATGGGCGAHSGAPPQRADRHREYAAVRLLGREFCLGRGPSRLRDRQRRGAWSFDHGRIWNAKLAPDAGSPSAPGGAWFERAALLSLYSPAESDARLPLPIIAKYQALIAPAQLGKIARIHAAYDAGGYGCVAYSWNATRDAYQRVELGSRGDIDVLNDAPAAHALSVWLHGVEHVLGLPPFAKPAPIQRRPRRAPPHR